MGLFRRIGRGIRRVVRNVVRTGKDVFRGVTRGIGSVAKGVIGVASKVLDKLPFGKAIKGFAKAFLNNPLALLTFGGVAGVGAMIGLSSSARQLAMAADIVAGTAAYNHPVARMNMMHMLAAQHAALHFHTHQHAHVHHHHHHHHYM